MSPAAPRAGAMPNGTPAPSKGGALSRAQKNRLRRQRARERALLAGPVSYAEANDRRDVIAAERRHDQRQLIEKLDEDVEGLVEIHEEAKRLRAPQKLVVEPEWHFREDGAR